MRQRMIPSFTLSGVLPPFVGKNPAHRPQCSPYAATMSELVSRFASSTERVALLRGLLDLRERMSSLGITAGFQWIDGSFVEDIEMTRGRSPADIDVVTVAHRPESDPGKWRQIVFANQPLFDPAISKSTYGCDAYFIDLAKRPDLVVADSIYFFSLFSHQRVNSTWKGMILVPLVSDDQVARTMLD